MQDHGLVDARTGASLGEVCLPFVLLVGDMVTHQERAYVVLERHVTIPKSPHGIPKLWVILKDDGPARSF